MKRLVLLRHGESVWNLANRFTGWTDVDLSDNGKAEAKKAGSLLKQYAFSFDHAYSSVLKRAIRTLCIVLDELDAMWLPVEHDWRLNERHYGALQGLNKAETAAKYGEEQVHLWRRSYDIPPPLLEPSDPRHPKNDLRYTNIPADQLPCGESLKDTLHRLLPYWHSTLAPALNADRKILIVAHGNSLRALVQYLDNLSNDEILQLNIPTGIPLVYELDDDLKPIRHGYLREGGTSYTTCQPSHD